ncbi:9124_t:CDS:10 [Acaulospora colombiana]|uniref:9124_t:CDS:1 n=1 Tax=Acaulospora colombiana TaxID=27376 RepID=A0ACA9NB33_9GLOM|nr:9124_t:CDS:10 [Acaulospora colombiana]
MFKRQTSETCSSKPIVFVEYETKVGETWEETLEKVLVELRATEYAAAFLKPVKKSEAWDYDRVIKHPMDLQTMGRKIKSHSYMSKKAFGDDLTLIWDNCLTYNTDPNHPLRRAAQIMRKKSDAIMRRIPDRHERFAPSMIDRFKFTFSSPAPSSPSLQRQSLVVSQTKGQGPNGVTPSLVVEGPALVNGIDSSTLSTTALSGTLQGAPTTTSASTLGTASTAAPPPPATIAEGVDSEAKVTFKMGWSDKEFADRPALERSAESMGAFVSLNQQMDDFLASLDWDDHGESRNDYTACVGTDTWISSWALGSGYRSARECCFVYDYESGYTCNATTAHGSSTAYGGGCQSDAQAGEESVSGLAKSGNSMTVAPDGTVIKRSDSPDPTSSEILSKKRKRTSRQDDLFGPRKRAKLEKISLDAERNPLENWWLAVGSTTLLANAVPESFDSPPQPNLRHPRFRKPATRDGAMDVDTTPSKKRQSSVPKEKRSTLFKIMSENVRVRKRAREIAIKIADQIEDEKQGVDPEDFAPLVPPADVGGSLKKAKPWSQRAGLASRRREEYVETEISQIQAQDCMESVSTLILEHANFDSASASALRAFGDVAGKCIQNLGRTLKVLHETHHGKMTGEEMVLHALFSNSIGTVHELEAYIKGDIVKHGNNLSNMLNTLEEAAKRDEPVDEDAMFNDDNEVMTGLGDLGEDPYGFREMGLDAEFGLKTLIVPKRLLRPSAKAKTNDLCVSCLYIHTPLTSFCSGKAAEAEKYPTPPQFAPLETKRINDQIGLLQMYYHQRIAAITPIPPPLPPPRVATPPVATPIIPPKPPTPEPIPVEESSPKPEPEPAIKPVFDPYNPSALSIVVPIVPKQTLPASSTSAAATPTPAPAGQVLTGPDGSTIAPDGTVLPPVAGLPPLPGMESAPPSQMMFAVPEPPPILEDDEPDPSRVKVGPLGQIQVPSAATVAKQKRQHRAAQAKAAAAAAAATGMPPGTPVSAPLQSPSSATKSKKPSPKKPKKVEPVAATAAAAA